MNGEIFGAVLPRSQIDIMHNARRKDYPDGMSKITVASRKVFREKGWELSERSAFDVKIPKPQSRDPETRSDSVKRAKDRIFDIIAMNTDKFRYFVTLTIDPKKHDSKSEKEVIRLLRHFLKNAVSRYGLTYILIPEFHKDGKIHMHGFFNDSLKLTDSGTRIVSGYEKPLKIETIKRKKIPLEQCKVVYNVPQWKHGFSTAEEVNGDCDRLFGYVTKYITKDLSKIFGNFYYAGGDLRRDVPYELYDTDYCTFECDNEVYCEPAKTGFKYLKIKA